MINFIDDLQASLKYPRLKPLIAHRMVGGMKLLSPTNQTH
jgi:hypothetical protein